MDVTWKPSGPCAISNGRFTICRSPQDRYMRVGDRIVYTLTDAKEIVAVERNVENTDQAKREAIARLKARTLE